MKKNNIYLTKNEIDLRDFIKSVWREKILILSISIFCGLLGYLFAFYKPQDFKISIKLKYPHYQLFQNYTSTFDFKNNLDAQFIPTFKVNFLSLDNLQSFLNESREFNDFKEYLKSRNISAKKYFLGRINQEKNLNLVIEDQYSLVFPKELDGVIFFNNYVEFVKKKTIIELKKSLKTTISHKIFILEDAFEKAKFINLEDPFLISKKQSYEIMEDNKDLFYRGSKILSQDIIFLKKLLIKLEEDQFNFEILLDKSSESIVMSTSMPKIEYFALGLMFGFFLSLGIIFFRAI